jgi:uncharacterized protein YndB with AHSA1/START domain
MIDSKGGEAMSAKKNGYGIALALGAMLMATPAQAEVKEASDSGFTVSHVKVVPASAAKVWAALAQPARWWSDAHSWSGDAKNLTLEPKLGGCFCERWSDGAAEHARVIHVQNGKVLRLRGSLGPLQSEALVGTLTYLITPEGTGTKIIVDYVVGGHASFGVEAVAPAVDGVIGEQVASLARLLGGS